MVGWGFVLICVYFGVGLVFKGFCVCNEAFFVGGGCVLEGEIVGFEG